MKKWNSWKIASVVLLVALVGSNLFWIYQIIDQGANLTHHKEDYTRKEKDVVVLRKLLETDYNKEKLLSKLDSLKLDGQPFEKDGLLVIPFSSFDVIIKDSSEKLDTKGYSEL